MDRPAGRRELELRDYLAIFRRRKRVIAATTLAFLVGALILSVLQKPVYRATADVLLQPRISEEIFAPGQQQQTSQQASVVQTEIKVMLSKSVQKPVTAALGHTPDVTITASGATDVVSISAESHDPSDAAHIAQTYAEIYVKTRREGAVNDLLAASSQIQQQIAKVDTDIATVEKPVTDLDDKILAANNATDRQTLRDQRDQLSQQIAEQRQALETRRSAYADQLDRLQLASNLTQTGGAQIVSEADPPASPIRPTPFRYAAIALLAGLAIGVGLAFLREHLDDAIRTRDDLDFASGGLTMLTMVPEVTTWKDRLLPTIVSLSHPKSPAAESYRALRTAVQVAGIEKPVGIIQITSPAAAEGKTTTLANLGVALARAGKRVVMVDCDLRRPRIESFFGVSNEVGFTDVLVGDADLGAAVQRVPNEPRLAVLPAGVPPPNPSELLTTKRAADVLQALRMEADYVLVDCPPLLPVADSIVIAAIVEATIIVITANTTTKRQLARSLELLAQVDAATIGVVLNGVGQGGGYGYGYGYGYSYGYASTNGHQNRTRRRLLDNMRRHDRTPPDDEAEQRVKARS